MSFGVRGIVWRRIMNWLSQIQPQLSVKLKVASSQPRKTTRIPPSIVSREGFFDALIR